MPRQIVYILGDIHGDFEKLNDFIADRVRNFYILREIASEYRQMRQPFNVLIFQVGDFGYFWPGQDNRGKIKNDVDFLPGGKVRIYWCGGNHEDWDQIDALFGRMPRNTPGIETEKGICHCRFGSTLKLADGSVALFAGGAESIDKTARLREMSTGENKIWWKQEGISDEDMKRLSYVKNADIVISHTAPEKFNLRPWIGGNSFNIKQKVDNTSRIKLNDVLEQYNPKKWFFGHFHAFMKGTYKSCAWTGLNLVSGRKKGDDYWATLDIEPEKPYGKDDREAENRRAS